MADENTKNNMSEKLAQAQAVKEETKDEIEALQAQLQALQAEHEEKMKAMQKESRAETDYKLDRARAEINEHLDKTLLASLGDASHRHDSKTRDAIKDKSTDVLRMNKIFRDVARNLGPNWRPVYETLTLSFSPQVTDMELRKIEQQKPFMQAYKALTSWRDLAGKNFKMADLADALSKCNLQEVADMVLCTMDSEGEALFTLTDVGKGIAPGVDRQLSSEARATGEAATAAGAEGQSRPAAPAAPSANVALQLEDRDLLRLAKGIGGSWMDLGRALQFPDDELQEILQNEGMNYQGAFRVMWIWKDRNEGALYQDNVKVLQEALRKTGRDELADSLVK